MFTLAVSHILVTFTDAEFINAKVDEIFERLVAVHHFELCLWISFTQS